MRMSVNCFTQKKLMEKHSMPSDDVFVNDLEQSLR